VLCNVSQPKSVRTISHKVALDEVVVGGDVGQISSRLLVTRQALNLQLSHEFAHQLRIHDETMLNRQRRPHSSFAVSLAGLGVNLGDDVAEKQLTNLTVTGHVVLVAVERRTIEAHHATGRSFGITQVA